MNCVVCNEPVKGHILEGIANPRHVGNPIYNYCECPNCKLWMLDPYPSQDILNKIYDKDYNLYENVSDNIATKIMNLFSQNREVLTARYCKSGQKLLDVGCGNGSFLYEMQQRNIDTYGTEWSEYAAGLAKKKLHSEHIFNGEVKNIPWQTKFDCITSWHVLEHNPDPMNFIQNIAERLTNLGYLIIEVPNSESEVLKQTREKYPWFSIPEHVTYWSDASLRFLAQQNHFRVISSQTPFSMPFLYAKTGKNSIGDKIYSLRLQWAASNQKKGDILRQVWQYYG